MEIKNKLIELYCGKHGKVAKTLTAIGVGVCSAAPAFADAETLATDATTVTTLATSVMGLFSTYPLNIILAMGLLGGVIGVVSQLKNAAG